MEKQPLVIERIYNANIQKVWKAITNRDQMKEWYFDLKEFRAEKGFRFQFTGGDENVQFLHECEVLEVDPPNKLSYSWRYPDYSGYSVLTFELFPEGEKKTRLRLTHEGLDSFPQDNKNFGVASFTAGWNEIIGNSLKNYIETEIITKSMILPATAEKIWEIVLHPNNTWGMAFGGGAWVETGWKVGEEVIWRDMAGNIGARGVVKAHEPAKYLEVDMYDDINPAPGTDTGEYIEKFTLSTNENGQSLLIIEAGPLSRKYLEMHEKMWDEAVAIIRRQAEV